MLKKKKYQQPFWSSVKDSWGRCIWSKAYKMSKNFSEEDKKGFSEII